MLPDQYPLFIYFQFIYLFYILTMAYHSLPFLSSTLPPVIHPWTSAMDYQTAIRPSSSSSIQFQQNNQTRGTGTQEPIKTLGTASYHYQDFLKQTKLPNHFIYVHGLCCSHMGFLVVESDSMSSHEQGKLFCEISCTIPILLGFYMKSFCTP